ncbi:MAG: phosphatidylserine decarboxylase [Campylobacter sp.]|nr:phosphatidylserine decarboxylase [Campylobacter sp.]
MTRNTISRVFGKIAWIKFPKFIQNPINNYFIKHFKIQMNEFKQSNQYPSLNSLFTRELVTPRALGEASFISPCDGRILDLGNSKNNKAISIKGKTYKLNELLDENVCDELMYANLYLSPRDYHHYHAPCNMEVLEAKYLPANLYKVEPKTLKKIPNLYAKNERVALKCKFKNNEIFWIVFVGAFNVGKIKFDFDKKIQTNAKLGKATYRYENLHFLKGEHLGNFELGSTIIILLPSKLLKFVVHPDTIIKFGDNLAEIL